MDKIKKRFSERESKIDLDQRLACGWDVEIEGSGQRKRYLRSLKTEKAV